MQRKFLVNLLFLLFLNLLVKPFWIFGIDRTVQNVVGADGYGSYFALLNLTIVLNILLDGGITNYNNRNISQHQHLLGKYFSNLVAIRFLLAVLYAIICFIIGNVSGYNSHEMNMLMLLCFNQFMLSFIMFLRSNLAGLQLFKTDSLISVTDRLLMIIMCGLVLWTSWFDITFTIDLFVQLQTAAYGFTMLLALALVIRHSGFRIPTFNLKLFRVIMKQSLPFAMLILLMSIYGRIDGVLLERLAPNGATQAGIFAQAFRLLDAGNMFAYLFAVLLLPMFARMLKLGESVAKLSSLALKLLVVPASVLALICFFYSDLIMGTMYQAEVASSSVVLSILMFALIPMAGSYVIGTLLTANGSLTFLNIIAVVAVFLSVVLNVFLIPHFGAVGSAIAALSVQCVVFISQAYVSAKLLNAMPPLKQIFKFGLMMAVLSVAGHFMTKELSNELSLPIFIAISLALALGLRLIEPLAIIRLIKQKNEA